MRKFEITFNSLNTEIYPKPVTMLVLLPEETGPGTGVMLFSHGWGGNRFQHLEKMEYTVNQQNLI